jgi:hypothetical protein
VFQHDPDGQAPARKITIKQDSQHKGKKTTRQIKTRKRHARKKAKAAREQRHDEDKKVPTCFFLSLAAISSVRVSTRSGWVGSG